MLFLNNSTDTLLLLFAYLFIYNISMVALFWILFQFVSFNVKTLHSFSDLKFNHYFTVLLTVILFSVAGVPPFIGFFSKLFILILLINSNFFFFYIFFFALLFFGLYFYLQNIRFLYSTGKGKISYAFTTNLRVSTIFLYITNLILFFLVFGFFFMDDFIFYFSWLLN